MYQAISGACIVCALISCRKPLYLQNPWPSKSAVLNHQVLVHYQATASLLLSLQLAADPLTSLSDPSYPSTFYIVLRLPKEHSSQFLRATSGHTLSSAVFHSALQPPKCPPVFHITSAQHPASLRYPQPPLHAPQLSPAPFRHFILSIGPPSMMESPLTRTFISLQQNPAPFRAFQNFKTHFVFPFF